MRLQHRISVYPPRVKMTVAVESQGGAFTLPMNIRGCSSNYNLDTGIIFPIGKKEDDKFRHVESVGCFL